MVEFFILKQYSYRLPIYDLIMSVYDTYLEGFGEDPQLTKNFNFHDPKSIDVILYWNSISNEAGRWTLEHYFRIISRSLILIATSSDSIQNLLLFFTNFKKNFRWFVFKCCKMQKFIFFFSLIYKSFWLKSEKTLLRWRLLNVLFNDVTQFSIIFDTTYTVTFYY